MFSDLSVKTMEDAINANLPTIGQSVNQYSEKGVQAYIKLWLIDLNMSTNLKRKLDESQMNFIAMIITQDYRNLKLSDVYLVFRNAKSGTYGVLYELLSPDKVLSWFKDWETDRIELCEMLSIRESSKHKHGTSERSTPLMNEIFKKLGNVSSGMSSIKDRHKNNS